MQILSETEILSAPDQYFIRKEELSEFSYPTNTVKEQSALFLEEEDRRFQNVLPPDEQPTNRLYNRCIRDTRTKRPILVPIRFRIPPKAVPYTPYDKWAAHNNRTWEFLWNFLDARFSNNVNHPFFTGEEGTGKSLNAIAFTHIMCKLIYLISQEKSYYNAILKHKWKALPPIWKIAREEVEPKNGLSKKMFCVTNSEVIKAYEKAPRGAFIFQDEIPIQFGIASTTDPIQLNNMLEAMRIELKCLVLCGVPNRFPDRMKWKLRTDINNWHTRKIPPDAKFTVEEFVDFLLEKKRALTRFYVSTMVMVGSSRAERPWGHVWIEQIAEIDRPFLIEYCEFKEKTQAKYAAGGIQKKTYSDELSELILHPRFTRVCYRAKMTKGRNPQLIGYSLHPEATKNFIREHTSIQNTNEIKAAYSKLRDALLAAGKIITDEEAVGITTERPVYHEGEISL